MERNVEFVRQHAGLHAGARELAARAIDVAGRLIAKSMEPRTSSAVAARPTAPRPEALAAPAKFSPEEIAEVPHAGARAASLHGKPCVR